jgi:hypothetical protein
MSEKLQEGKTVETRRGTGKTSGVCSNAPEHSEVSYRQLAETALSLEVFWSGYEF